jgi:hypothetical protein
MNTELGKIKLMAGKMKAIKFQIKAHKSQTKSVLPDTIFQFSHHPKTVLLDTLKEIVIKIMLVAAGN